MAIFFGTFENKVDSKGRVSLPASFRQGLATSSYKGFIGRTSFRTNAIEACDLEYMEQLTTSVSANELYSDEHDDLAFTIFGDSYPVPFDKEGRMNLPTELTDPAGITTSASFVGLGQSFQIWEPVALRTFKEQARNNARTKGLTLALPQREDNR